MMILGPRSLRNPEIRGMRGIGLPLERHRRRLDTNSYPARLASVSLVLVYRSNRMTDIQPRNSMFLDEFKHQLPDLDEAETEDWIRSLDDVVAEEGETRARFLLFKLLKRARQLQVGLPPLTNTRYINTISPEQEPSFPGDEAIEHRIRRIIRWNAVAMVLRANTKYSGIGGHPGTYASAATLYEVGFNWFFKGRDNGGPGDPIFYQGHAAPGLFSRALLQ